MKRLLAACLLLSACAAPPPPKPQRAGPTGPGQREMAVLVGLMTGTWDARPNTTPIRLRIVEFWKGRPNESWLYLEWVKPGEDGRPLRQRIYRISEGGGRIIAEAFLPPGRDPAAWAGEWRQAAPFARLSPGDLRPLEGCDIQFEYKHAAVFSGGTLARSCRGDRHDAAAERSEFMFAGSDARNLEQGFDAQGRPIAAETRPYELGRSSREVR